MSTFLRAISADAIQTMTPTRQGERKLGQTVGTLSGAGKLAEELRALPDARFALLLVPEDIGVRANFGRAGAAALAQTALRRLLAMQDNNFLRGESIVVLGEVLVQDLMQQAVGMDANRPADSQRLCALVGEVDARVASVVEVVAREGRTLIVFGGGHENAYGLLAGLHAAIGSPLACVNLDAHADLRDDAGRHSGNPFSKAMLAGNLSRYAAIGLHESFLNQHMSRRLRDEPALQATTLDSILRGECSLTEGCARAVKHVGAQPCTLEVDLDVIAGMAASAISASGLQAEDVRRSVHQLANALDLRALHICEGIPGESDASGAGKLAAMIACDFIKCLQGKA